MSSNNAGSLLSDIDIADTGKKAKKEASGGGGGVEVPGWAQALIILAALGIAGWTVWSFSGSTNKMEASSRERVLIDVNTGEVFESYRISEGDSVPFKNPDTGENTLWPAEECFWTVEGGASLEPHYVLLDEYKGLPGPTKCPVCGRVVKQHNPLPPIEVLVEAAEAAQP
ncbi:MAG: hypothetical protein AAGI53_06910 [Planctomycetota bacterium]